MVKKVKSPARSAPEAVASPSAIFPIVGIGASAGGLAAFQAFFSGLPAGFEPGMAFVLVQHLAPDHPSMLPELVRRFTHLPVAEIQDGMPVKVNSVYIIPPNRDLALLGGTLHLLAPVAARGQRLPIDDFFRSLARDQQHLGVGIVLSGTGSDGTLGVRAIKEAGGLVLAQSPDSAEFDGMPRSAIATGLVDAVLSPADMADQLRRHVQRAGSRLSLLASQPSIRNDNALNKIFALLRGQTGHDFAGYKPSTVHRRIERRMAAHQIDSVDAYVELLQHTPAESEALFRDLLIGVSNFFRDPEAFQVLEEQAIPQLFAGKSTAGGVIRVWVAGCATGEEAYSIAILLQERMEVLRQSYTIQLFATDIDARAISVARAGLYPVGIAADVSPQRLARFFTPEADGSGYRIHKGIRDMLVFSVQSLIKDPPFSRLDLISCRNLLIYLGAELQKRLLPLFHFALNPRGLLFLGTSEGVGEATDLFTVLDRQARLYQRPDDLVAHKLWGRSLFVPPLSAIEAALPRNTGPSAYPMKRPLRALTEQALLQAVPAAALVNAAGDIFYLHGRTGLFLEPAPGEAGVNNILAMAREGLRPPLFNALAQAAATRQTVHAEGLSVTSSDHLNPVRLCVCPLAADLAADTDLPGAQTLLFLVMLEDAAQPDGAQLPQAGRGLAGRAAGDASASDLPALLDALRAELRAKDNYLQGAHEALERANQDLKSSNEEMQSVNEELQSTNEELETSREELQSLNEELSTVNHELNIRVEDLSRLNNDMNNLLAGTGIATVFVDLQLRILRFTPTATQLIPLISGDVGRPLGHLVTSLQGYTRLLADTQAVLDTLVPREVQVQTVAGAWFVLRIRPYRTLDNVIEGAVITFSDISEMKRVEEALEGANKLARLAVVVRDAHDAITVQDLDGRTLAWNPGAVRLYGWREEQALQMNVRERIPPDLREQALTRLLHLIRTEVLEPYRTQRLRQDGTVLDVWITATALMNEGGQMYAIATTERASGLG